MQRKLWIDTRGEPVITTTPNGERNARRWGWVEAEVIPKGDLTACPTNPKIDALRDFLLAELGLWRDPETGALIMTGSWNGAVHCARVIFPDGNADGYADAKHPDRYDQVVIRWRATLTPPSREPKPGEVWRVTLDDGSEYNALVGVVPTGAPVIWRTAGGGVLLDTCPADRRRILVEADGTVVAGDE